MPTIPAEGAAHDAHRTVDRVVAILEHAAATPGGTRLADVVQALAAPKSSVYGLMRGLVAAGYLLEDDGRYRIGPGVSALLARPDDRSLVAVAEPEMQRLSTASGETVILGTRVGQHVVHLAQVESTHHVRYVASLGERRPMLQTSIGKIFLADMDTRAIQRVLRRHEATDTDAARIEQQLEQVRHDGLAFNREESVTGVTAVAAGVRDVSDRLVAAICVAGPTSRVVDGLEHSSDELKVTVARIRDQLSRTLR